MIGFVTAVPKVYMFYALATLDVYLAQHSSKCILIEEHVRRLRCRAPHHARIRRGMCTRVLKPTISA